MCTNCTCILNVDQEVIKQMYYNYSVVLFTLPKTEYREIKVWTHEVTDVINEGVCTMLCSGKSFFEDSNSWRFDGNTGTCNCSWILSEECPESIDDAEMTSPVEPLQDIFDTKTSVYLQTEKTMPCGNPQGNQSEARFFLNWDREVNSNMSAKCAKNALTQIVVAGEMVIRYFTPGTTSPPTSSTLYNFTPDNL